MNTAEAKLQIYTAQAEKYPFRTETNSLRSQKRHGGDHMPSSDYCD
jgi:hypothetical protein